MKPYVFIKNEKGLIEFTENELRKLLDEIYNEGRRDGASQAYQPYVWNPSWTGDKWPIDKWTITTSDITTSDITPSYTFTTGTIISKEKK